METEIIEEKKALIDESIEEVSGGRYLSGRYLSSKELKTLSPETKENLMKSATRLDSLSRRELPKELLTQISGGTGDEDEDYESGCPYCGGPVYLYWGNGEWVFYCGWCSRIIAGSDFWTDPDGIYD